MRNLLAAVPTIHPEFIIRLTRWAFAAAWRPRCREWFPCRGVGGALFNPATMEAFSLQGDGTLTVVKENSPTSFAVEQTVKP